MLNYRDGLASMPCYDTSEQDWHIKVNANESNIGLPPLVEERVMTRLSRIAFARYPNEEYDLLCEQIGAAYGYRQENVIIGNGSSEIIEKVFYAFGGNDTHKIVYPMPSFSMYGIYAAAANSAGVPVPLKDGYTLDADMFIQTVNQNSASLAVICNPNNPTGQLMTTAEIEYIAKEISCAFLIDEAYAEFSEHSVFQLLKKYPHMMIARTFSKAYALASCRVGYMLAHRDVIDMIAKTYMPYHMNVPSLVTADTVFQMRSEFEPQIRMICEERERMQEKYKALDAVTVYPSHTNFILIHYPHAEALNKEFIKYGIGVRSFGKTPRLENTLRISIGRTDENDAVYRVMKAFVEGNP